MVDTFAWRTEPDLITIKPDIKSVTKVFFCFG